MLLDGMVEDEFDQYFARAKVDNFVQASYSSGNLEEDLRRRVSLPASRLGVKGDGVRRTASCKYPSNSKRQRDRDRSPRQSSDSPSSHQRPVSIALEQASSSGYVTEGGEPPGQNSQPTFSLSVPSPGVSSHSAPHSRSGSVKTRGGSRRGRRKDDGGETPEHPRSRNGSIEQTVDLDDTVIAQLERIKALQTDDLCPVRNFASSSKGLVNRGDSFKRKSKKGSTKNKPIQDTPPSPKTSVSPPDSTTATSSNNNLGVQESVKLTRKTSTGSERLYKVLVLGDQGVGKTALLQQFTTSEYMGAATQADTVLGDGSETTVSVDIDGEETTMDFHEIPYGDHFENHTDVDAYVVIYCLNDADTFNRAEDVLLEVHRHNGGRSAVILVGNKSELVRSRQVSEDEAHAMCAEYNTKYIELSAALNHKVDELLVGAVRQIRLNPKRQARKGKTRFRDSKMMKGLVGKLFKTKQQRAACENLNTLQ